MCESYRGTFEQNERLDIIGCEKFLHTKGFSDFHVSSHSVVRSIISYIDHVEVCKESMYNKVWMEVGQNTYACICIRVHTDSTYILDIFKHCNQNLKCYEVFQGRVHVLLYIHVYTCMST